MKCYNAIIRAPFGKLGLNIQEDAVTNIDFLFASESEVAPCTPLAELAVLQLQHYFADSTLSFSINFKLTGTPFQLTVWALLSQIKVGQVVTYGQLAKRLSTSARAIGGACRCNPLPIIIPCHRVISKADIGGFAGANTGAKIAIKRWLLRHEGFLGIGQK